MADGRVILDCHGAVQAYFKQIPMSVSPAEIADLSGVVPYTLFKCCQSSFVERSFDMERPTLFQAPKRLRRFVRFYHLYNILWYTLWDHYG
jgi:vacuolar-type H+-ATPase subunit I/STV1